MKLLRDCSCVELLSDRAEEGERVISDSGGGIDVEVALAGDDDVLGAACAQRGDEVGTPRVVSGGVAGQADDRDVARLAL